jgi:hypothetical protein
MYYSFVMYGYDKLATSNINYDIPFLLLEAKIV